MEIFLEIGRHCQRNGRLCDECGRRFIGGPSHLARHKLTHRPVSSSQADGQGADNPSANKTPRRSLPTHIDLCLAQEMILSTPAKIRFGGGTFQNGQLAGQTVSGYKEVFYVSGQVRKHFPWIRPSGIKPAITRRAASQNKTTP
ncbi:hypothetical protein ACHAPU_000715 [Fusarium lateritium]